MAVPLLHDERALGVLQVLDRPQDARFTLAEMDVLALFANQAAIALDLLSTRAARRRRSTRRMRALRSRGSPASSTVEGADREAGIRLVEALDDLPPGVRARKRPERRSLASPPPGPCSPSA